MNTKKIIWVFNQYASTPYNSTGAGERHFFLAKHLAQKKIYTYIFAASFNHLFKRIPVVKKKYLLEDFFGFSFIWVNSLKYSSQSFIGRSLSWLVFPFKIIFISKKHFQKPDIIIVSSMSMFPMIAAFFYKKKYNCKIIFEIRDIWPLTIESLNKSFVLKPLIKIMGVFERFCYAKSDYIISVLPFANIHIKQVYQSFHLDKFTWIPNGIEPEYMFSNESSENKIKIPNEYRNAMIITYAGALGQANAMEYFIDAIYFLNKDERFYFIIIGDGPNKKNYESKLNNCSNVEFIGKIHKGEVQSYLQLSNILYIGWYDLPIYKFGVSANKYNDYMLSGKPILTSSSIEDDVVSKSKCGIVVKPQSMDSIINGLNQFYYLSKVEKEIMGENGKQYVLNNNTFSVLSNQFVEIYNKLIL